MQKEDIEKFIPTECQGCGMAIPENVREFIREQINKVLAEDAGFEIEKSQVMCSACAKAEDSEILKNKPVQAMGHA